MFEALRQASSINKYQMAWVELAPVQFQTAIPKWLSQLNKSSLTGGPSKQQRIALGDEFIRLLNIQKFVLTERGDQIGAARAKTNVDWFAAEYKKKFGAAPAAPPGEERGLKELLQKQGLITHKLGLLDEKLQLVNFWLAGVKNFPEHREGASLMFQYMGNAPTAKVRLFLDVLCSDGEKVSKVMDDKILTMSYEVQKGLQTAGEGGKLTSVTWTDDRFKKAIKAEIGASYGVGVSGKAELEFKGIKAKLDAAAWAGARANASGEASYTKGQGVSVKGEVNAEIGVKLTANAALDCADIFLCEVNLEAFVGAMVKGEVEITATVAGVKAKISAEAFVGAKLTGTGSMTFKIQGYEMVKAEVTASLTAGIGASFGLDFECSTFGGTKFGIESGLTYGVGSEVKTAFTVYANNVGPALASLYYTSYLSALGKEKEKHAYVEYFRALGDNEKLFMKARGIIEDQMRIVILDRNAAFSQVQAWKELEGLAAFRA